MQSNNKNIKNILKKNKKYPQNQQSYKNPLLIPNHSITISKQSWKDSRRNTTYCQKFYSTNSRHNMYVHRNEFNTQLSINKQLTKPIVIHQFIFSNLKKQFTYKNPLLRMNFPICGTQITQTDKKTYQKIYSIKKKLKLRERKQQNIQKRKQSNLNFTTKSINVTKIKQKISQRNVSRTLLKLANSKSNTQNSKQEQKPTNLSTQYDEMLRTNIMLGHFRKWSIQSADSSN